MIKEGFGFSTKITRGWWTNFLQVGLLELALGKLHINMLFLETHGLKKLPQLHIRIYMFYQPVFRILMGRALLIRVRELASSSGNFLGWVGDCSGSLESVGVSF
ncbi:hypothetical protein QL285_019106 [Trifolium repens]|nr:hypothetical protein QL285_019106 [Trifolium repens]